MVKKKYGQCLAANLDQLELFVKDNIYGILKVHLATIM